MAICVAIVCGKLAVFANRESRTGRTIDLSVVVPPALDSDEKEAPLFELAGGPGVALTAGAFFYAGEGKEYRRHRDVGLADLYALSLSSRRIHQGGDG